MMAALRNRRFLFFGGAALVCLVILVGSFAVHLRQYYRLHMEQSAARERLQSLRQAVEGINQQALEEENQRLDDELSEIERSLPEREYMPTLIRQIESGAVITGNDLLELRPGEIRRGLVAAIGGTTGAASTAQGGEQAATQSNAQATAQGQTKPPAQAGAQGAGQAAQLQAGQRYSEMDIEVRLEGSYTGAFEFVRYLGKIGKIIAVELIEIDKSATDEKREDGRALTTIKLGCKAYILEPRSGFPGQISIKVY